MNSRDSILHTLRRQIIPQVGLPGVIDGPWIQFDDPLAKFEEMVKFVGGSCQQVTNAQHVADRLGEFAEFKQAKQTFSAVEGLPGNVLMDEIHDPHALESLDFVIYPGQFAVAENGAVWVSDENLKHRVCFFITQFLVLVVRKDSIVHNMHQAYQQAKVPRPGFGLFLSGPSKTADIEQSLVIGAHGCRELQVFLV